jgi:hypothetical protein
MHGWVKGFALCLAGMLAQFAFAADPVKDELTRIRVQLQFAKAVTLLCENEQAKVTSRTETPFPLSQANPVDSNRRFIQRQLTQEEEIAYDEFTRHCLTAYAEVEMLTNQLEKEVKPK